LAGSNAVESAATLMEFADAPHAPKHGPGNAHHNTVITRNTLNTSPGFDHGSPPFQVSALSQAAAAPAVIAWASSARCGLQPL